MRSIAGPIGHMITCAGGQPTGEEQFLAQVVAQQTGVAVSNAQLHARERAIAAELAQTNAALQETVATLRRGMQIHERLTRVAAAGEGAAGIAEALHDLTGLAVAVEDRYGNLSAWAGPGKPDPYPKPPAYDREQLLRRLMTAGRSVRDGDRVVALASPRPGVTGLLALMDPDRRAGTTDVMAIEHGATVLAVELARLRGVADTELRVRRELVQDLLTGTDDESAYQRAEALGYDLGLPHQVAVVELAESSPADEDVLLAVRRALRQQPLPALLGMMAGTVVIVAPAGEIGWDALRLAIVAQLGGGRCRVGVGEPYPRPSLLARSLREAQLALRLQKASSVDERTSAFADLDVLRMLASVDDLADVEGFVRKWLGVLADYDERKHAELLKTLTKYLQHAEVPAAPDPRADRLRPGRPGDPLQPGAGHPRLAHPPGPPRLAGGAAVGRPGRTRRPWLGPPGRGRGARAAVASRSWTSRMGSTCTSECASCATSRSAPTRCTGRG
jgi:GGDEF-like domain